MTLEVALKLTYEANFLLIRGRLMAIVRLIKNDYLAEDSNFETTFWILSIADIHSTAFLFASIRETFSVENLSDRFQINSSASGELGA